MLHNGNTERVLQASKTFRGSGAPPDKIKRNECPVLASLWIEFDQIPSDGALGRPNTTSASDCRTIPHKSKLEGIRRKHNRSPSEERRENRNFQAVRIKGRTNAQTAIFGVRLNQA